MRVGSDPIPMLLVKQISNEAEKQTFREQYLAGVDFIDDNYKIEIVQNRYPESDDQVFERAAQAQSTLV